jgi:hypothetical protein
MTRAEDVSSHLRRLEEALLDPGVRSDRTRVGELLADDFVEFGASGRIWKRDEILELLAGETPEPIAMADYACALLADDVALITYRAWRTDARTGTQSSSLRSSIWTKKPEEWRLRFHQGTRTS